jgi:prepilin peptidase CpaA
VTILSGALLLLLLVPAAVIDYRKHRIPNWLSLPGWAAGCVAGFVVAGPTGLQSAAVGLGIMVGMTLPFYLLGWMGAGDVKLMGAVGALVGGSWALPVLAAIVTAGAVMAFAILARNGRLGAAFTRFSAMLGLSVVASKPTYIGPSQAEARLVLPYAIPIAVGTLIVACAQLLGPG